MVAANNRIAVADPIKRQSADFLFTLHAPHLESYALLLPTER
jgi:hypothetical protein